MTISIDHCIIIYGDYMTRLIKNCGAVACIRAFNLLKLQHPFAITGSLSILVALYQGYSVCIHKKDSNVKLNLLLQDGALNIFISSSYAEINLIVLKKSSHYSSRFDNYEFFSEFACIKFQALHRLLVQN
jgi:hypothetical protein